MPGTNQNNDLKKMQGRYWLATIPYQDWQVPEVTPDKICYIKGQQEIGAGGYHHWQLLLITQKIRGPALKSLLCPTAHLELSRSEAAETYVWKDETRVADSQFEIGEKPFKRNSKIDWEKQREYAQKGELNKIDASVYIQHYNTLKRIAVDHRVMPDSLNDVCGVWIYGPPGVGKSHYARAHYSRGGLYLKNQNKWWCGYQNEQNVLIDDFDCDKLGHHLKIWADKYAFQAEIKGSSLCIRPKHIVITSNYSIDDLFTDSVLAAAIKRRFYMVHIPLRMF